MPGYKVDETDAASAIELEELKEGDLRMRDLAHPEVRYLFLVSLLMVALGTYLLTWVLRFAAGEQTVPLFLDSFLLTLVLPGFASAAMLWEGLKGLDSVDCAIREDHQCRRCEKELDRWRAE